MVDCLSRLLFGNVVVVVEGGFGIWRFRLHKVELQSGENSFSRYA
jgi:hypothetical protein